MKSLVLSALYKEIYSLVANKNSEFYSVAANKILQFYFVVSNKNCIFAAKNKYG